MRLEGMNQIKDYVRRSDATVLEYIRQMEFPAAKLKGIWISDTQKIDDWFGHLIENGSTAKSKPASTKKRSKRKK